MQSKGAFVPVGGEWAPLGGEGALLGGEGAPLGGEGAPFDGLGAQVTRDFSRLAMDTSWFLLSARMEAVEGDLGARGGGGAALPDLGSFGLLPRFFRK